MTVFKKIFDFYIQGSIHVALSCSALVGMTQHMFGIHNGQAMVGFAFFGTIVGYNFVKYDALVRITNVSPGIRLKSFAVLSAVAFIGAVYTFFHLHLITQFVSAAFLGLTLLYTLPFFPNRRNARNWAGVKIYIVSLCWVGVTVVMPLIDEQLAFTTDFYLKCIQRFILVFVLVLIFEIIDLKNDDPHLHTVPQQIGVVKTKMAALFLLLVFYMLEFFNANSNSLQLLVNFVLIIIIGLFIVFANEKRSKYYTSFWVEALPVLWLGMVVLATQLSE